jgi:hypothetical protein
MAHLKESAAWNGTKLESAFDATARICSSPKGAKPYEALMQRI